MEGHSRQFFYINSCLLQLKILAQSDPSLFEKANFDSYAVVTSEIKQKQF